jgi:IS6 family transposase
VLAVRWYLRFGPSYRDLEELLAERGVVIDHVTIYRWVLRFTPLLADAARPCRHRVGDRWQVDETYMKVAGRWRYVYRAIDQFRQVIDVFVASRRDTKAAIASSNRPSVRRRSRRLRSSPIRRRCTRRCWKTCCRRPGTAPTATPTIGSSATWETEGAAGSDARPQQDRSARVIIAGHALVQNLRRGHYELAVDEPTNGEWRSHATNWSWRSDPSRGWPSACPGSAQRNSAPDRGSLPIPFGLAHLDGAT